MIANKIKLVKSVVTIWLSITFLTGCSNGSDGDEDKIPFVPGKPVAIQHLKLQPAENCDDLKTFITDSLVKQYATIPQNIHYFYCPTPVDSGGGFSGDLTPSPAPVNGDEAGAVESKGPDQVSDTNNQEAGVNEADIVKVDEDGTFYLVSGRHFIVAKGFPPTDISELARIDLGGRGLSLFLDKENKRVTITARHDEPLYIADAVPTEADESLTAIYPKPESDYSVVLFYDVTTPGSPQLIEQYQLQGYVREGRRIDDRVHLVSNHHLRPANLFADMTFKMAHQEFNDAIFNARCNNPDEDITTNPNVLQAREKLVGAITTIVASEDPKDSLPKAYQVANGTSNEIPYLSCSDVSFPDIRMSLGLQVISSVNTDGSNLQATSIVNNSYITYASENNLYLAETSRNWWWLLEDGSRPSSQTAIYKFAISGDAPEYVATGRVDGYVLNQFSFSEYNSALRVATTEDDFVLINENQWRRQLTNHLSVLTDNGAGDLSIVGEVRDIVKDENIRSARFYDDKGFIVTFRNIDPLFTFDLSNPENPSLEGHLEIPGFSTYIHSYDENTLLTIGQSGGPDGFGVGNGIQLQLIDVSDMKQPKVAKSLVPSMPGDWSWSSAQYDHKAFTFFKPANLLAIPLQISPSHSADYFSGVVAYNVTLENGFEEIGRMDHKDLSWEYYCNQSLTLLPEYQDHCSNGWYIRWSAPRRSSVMTSGDNVYLYTMSDVGIKAAATTDLSNTLGQLIFPLQPYPWWRFGYYPVGVVDPMPMVGIGLPEPMVMN